MSSYHCYCQVDVQENYMLCCDVCKKYFHTGCLKSGRPTSLLGDTFFKFICQHCSPTGEEVCLRLKLQWTQVLLLALYNLQFEGGGKQGYFRWREHVCAFIDRHWDTFFGNKKKTNTWHGTVAGTLSGGCPHFFKSGTVDLGETGWWALNVSKIPAAQEFENQSVAKLNRKQKQPALFTDMSMPVEGLRHRSHKSAIVAAMELKEKRSTMQEVVRKRSQPKTSTTIKSELISTEMIEEPNCSSKNSAFELCLPSSTVNMKRDASGDIDDKTNDECLELDFEIAQEAEEIRLGILDLEESSRFSPGSPQINELLSTLDAEALADVSNEEIVDVSSQMDEEDRGDFNVENISSSLSSSSSSRSASRMGEESIEVGEEQAQHPSPVCRKRKINPREDVPEEEDKPRCVLMSVYEEHELLKKLEKLGSVVDNHPVAKRLRRKLLVRQKQRALNLPLFDLDAFMRQESLEQKANFPEMAASPSNFLDRYMMSGYNLVARSHVNFLTRLMGLEEEQMESTTSPYTLRCLKPFIFRDYETVPLKLKLLQEIFSYPHRNDFQWTPPQRHPIDYCYVRPHHIPAANALCHEFFWPGIDLSECLQYPDFSCVALYRKIVIGFAFMVPDVSYNEAYISFIFTHPEWRNAGIATFMLYHLIQTCMGKDVTLHVSATNPACFLYQKFGFKVEEFIVDFYNKYLPVTSKDCRNALFLRLSR